MGAVPRGKYVFLLISIQHATPVNNLYFGHAAEKV